MIRQIDHGGSIADLLMMIERRAPVMMRVGGCGITGSEPPPYAPPLTAEVRSTIADLTRQGKDMREIAAITGCHYSTVCKHTRALRGKV